MPNSNSSSSRRRLIVIVTAAVIIIIALFSAFVWPGWAMKDNGGDARSLQTQSAAATPTIEASALPKNASELVKAFPDAVANYARTGVEATKDWESAKPVEEYAVTYSTGAKSKDVAMVIGQWSNSSGAKTQYDKLTAALEGDTLAHGNVKVSGANKGTYVVKTDADDDAKAVAVWQNDTVVFQVTGGKDAVMAFYQKFPM
ncbi:hypothetical protein GFD17_00240 [Bifidobacterium sp. SMB2]|uniref:Secreted protein n=1 Tax=Bifidobacterium saimiriisciurei TaxID=2661627 RepID=A0ABX0CEG2_9BIFI|nr:MULTISPECIES: hypothetical protein [Bifidobacterium]NEG95212.1 hypothetical protein [Bifidobacterium sp. SMB2]NEH11289.1 hypothetical protein [Bifidobacterium saimiriisciurei]